MPTDVPAAQRLARTLLRVAGVLLGLQIAFFGLLVVSQGLPDRLIVAQLADGVREGTYGPASLPDRMGGVGDSFTECVVVGTGLGPAPGESLLHQAGRMPRLSNCVKGSDQILALDAGESAQDSSYYKYWAGYSVLVRPILAMAGIEGVRIVMGALLAGSLIAAWVTLARLTRWWIPSLMLGPLLLASNLMSTPSTGFHGALTWSVILLGVAATAMAVAHSEARGLHAIAVSAAVYCYIDLLTNPAAGWSLTVCAAAVVHWWQVRNVASTRRLVVVGGLLWIAAFTFTWVSRWVWAMLFLGPREVIATVRSNVAFRTAGEWATVDPGFGQGLISNVTWWLTRVPTAWLVLSVSVALILGILVQMIRRGPEPAPPAGFIALSAVPIPLWLLVVSNHSQIHAFLTYRLVPTFIAVVLVAAASGAWGPSPAGPGAWDEGVHANPEPDPEHAPSDSARLARSQEPA